MTHLRHSKMNFNLSFYWWLCITFELFFAGIVVNVWYFKEPFSMLIASYVAYAGLFLCAIAVVLTIIEGLSKWPKKHFLIAGIFLKVFLVLIISTFFVLYLIHYPAFYDRCLCQVGLRNLSHAMYDYCQQNKQYPTSDKWCDLILDFTRKNTYRYGENFRENLTCPSVSGKECSYALNPKAGFGSMSQTVLLFECKDGWNRFGGPETAAFENHKEGCNVLFVDGQIKCVSPETFEQLKW